MFSYGRPLHHPPILLHYDQPTSHLDSINLIPRNHFLAVVDPLSINVDLAKGKGFSMAGLAYSRPNPDKIAPGIEALLRKELGSSPTPPEQILPRQGEDPTTKKSFSEQR